jgi:hypothetical protein
MNAEGRRDRHFERLPADRPLGDWEGPSFSRGWIRIRAPWRHPVEVARFASLWRRLKWELDRAPGLVSFEYRVILRPLMVGMHIAWRDARDEHHFIESSSHGAVAAWSRRSPLTPALRLEHFAVDAERRLIRLGGFLLYERPEDLPSDAVIPLPGDAASV